jgi:hypothetical protein
MTYKTLNLLTLVFFLVLLAAISFSLLTTKGYRLANETVLQQTVHENYMVDYSTLNKWLNTSFPADMVVIDLRSGTQFMESNFRGSKNIPSNELFKTRNRRVLSGNKTKLLVADKESKAHIVRMMLLSKGYTNILVLAGDYQTASQHTADSFDPSFAFYRDEKAKWDYTRFFP